MPTIWVADPAIRSEQITAIKAALPKTWTVSDDISQADFIVNSSLDINDEFLKKTKAGLQGIIQLIPGSGKITTSDIPVYRIYDTSVTSVAEHTILLILALGRRLIWLTDKVKKQEWADDRSKPILTDQKKYTYNWVNLPESGQLHGKTVGIVGFGFIGQELAKRLRVFNARVIYFDTVRKSDEVEKELNVRFVPYEELLRQADFITLHLRFAEGKDGNEKMFNAQAFELMKPTAYFINTSRGRMVDEQALFEAIKQNKIAGAGLDVYEFEPMKPDNPLLQLIGDRVILTPHIAGTSMQEGWDTIAKEIVDIATGGNN